jgi:hypothetical protein
MKRKDCVGCRECVEFLGVKLEFQYLDAAEFTDSKGGQNEANHELGHMCFMKYTIRTLSYSRGILQSWNFSHRVMRQCWYYCSRSRTMTAK